MSKTSLFCYQIIIWNFLTVNFSQCGFCQWKILRIVLALQLLEKVWFHSASTTHSPDSQSLGFHLVGICKKLCCDNTSKTIVELKKKEIECAENCYGNNVQESDYQFRKSHSLVPWCEWETLYVADIKWRWNSTPNTCVILKVNSVIPFLYHENVSSWIQFSRCFPRCLRHSLSVALRSLRKHVNFLSFVLLSVLFYVLSYIIKNRSGWRYLCWSFKLVSFLFWKLSKFEIMSELWITLKHHIQYRC